MSVFSDVDEYGFKRPEDFDYKVYEKFMSSYLIILTNRSMKWFNIMQQESPLKMGAKLKRYILKGIPSVYRAQVWAKISDLPQLKSVCGVNLYREKLNMIIDDEIVQAIRIDLPRTFPENIYFASSNGCREQLFRVLFAFAGDHQNIGYCQGLNYIAGLLLLVTKDEETSFWLLKVIVEHILPNYYGKNMRGLKVDIEVFALLVRIKMPDLQRRMNDLSITWSLLVMKWFVCLYVEVLPIETVLRIWDCMFCQHSKILFRIGLTMVSQYRQILLGCNDFASFVNCFKKMPLEPFVLDCHNFMKKVNLENKFITNKKLKKWRKQVSVDSCKQD